MADSKAKKKRKPTLPSDVEWCDATLRWYKTWRSSNRTDTWDDAQWYYLQETAMVHHMAMTTFNPMALSELRKREAYMGLTFDAPTQVVEIRHEETAIDRYSKRRKSRQSNADNKDST